MSTFINKIKVHRINTYICFLLIICGSFSYSQSRTDLLEYGDEAFFRKDYISAAYFYGKIIGSYESGKDDLVYPYQLSSWNKPLEKGEKSGVDTSAGAADTVIQEPVLADTAAQQAEKSSQSAKDSTGYMKSETYQYALYKLAESYRLSFNYQNAEIIYEKCLKNDPAAYPLVRFWYALSNKKNMKYDIALQEFGEFMNVMENTDDSLSQEFLLKARTESSGCVLSITMINNPREGTAARLADSIINAGSSNFAANFFNHDSSITFTSARPSSQNSKNNNGTEWFCDLYSSEKTDEGWAQPKSLGPPINSIAHEGAGVISSNMQSYYFTRWGDELNPNASIFISKFYNRMWLQPMKLDEQINMPGYNTMHPALFADEEILFFASDRPGGFGGMDIWYCTIDEFGNVGQVINPGPLINTGGDEVTPFYQSVSKTLYFSSNGHFGMGGLDVFKNEGTIDNWSEPENIGYPINSSRDDLYFVLTQSQRTGYMTSDREDCPDCAGGASCYNLYEVNYAPVRYTLSGHVYSKISKKPIPNALVNMQDVYESIEPSFIITDDDGFYHTKLRTNMSYYLKAQKVRYFADASNVSTVGLNESVDFVRDFYLNNIPVGEIDIAGIYYDLNSWTLRPESKPTLDSLVFFLEVNDNIVIELSSHTDERGADDFNLDLSQKRAQSVVDFLTENGVEVERLKPAGYGETRLKAVNAVTEEEHQLNRRTSFEVIGEEFITKKKKKYN